MKIIQVQTQAEAAGAQRISGLLGEGLRRRGHDARTIFMYRKTDAYDADPHADFILRGRPRGLRDQVKAAVGLLSYLRNARPDVIISYQHYGNIFGTIGGRIAGAQRIITNQSGAPGQHGFYGVEAIDFLMGTLGLYHFKVANSEWTESQFASYPAVYKGRVRRIDHGVKPPSERFDKYAARAAFGLPDKVWLVATAGRLTKQKNQLTLVGALGKIPDIHVALAGVGPERDNLETFAQKQGVEDRLHFVGEVPPSQMFKFLAAADTFVFNSQSETFGLAVVEAAMSGVPVVCSGLPVLREVLVTERGAPAGLFLDTNDVDGVVKAIVKIMERPDLARDLVAAGQTLVAKYSPERMCAAYESLWGCR